MEGNQNLLLEALKGFFDIHKETVLMDGHLVILDANDSELLRILKMLKNNSPSDVVDNLYIKLANIVQNFGEIEDVEFDKNSVIEQNIYKAALVLSNKNIYSDSFTQV